MLLGNCWLIALLPGYNVSPHWPKSTVIKRDNTFQDNLCAKAALSSKHQRICTPPGQPHTLQQGIVTSSMDRHWQPYSIIEPSPGTKLWSVAATKDQHNWAPLTGWKVASFQALGEHVDVVMENFAVHNVHMFMHKITEPFDPEHVKEICVDPDIIKPESIFIDASISNSKIASRFT